MKKIYLAISLSNRIHFDQEIQLITGLLEKYRYSLFVFVDIYQFSQDQEKEMMQQAFRDIEQSDLLIAEVSKKAIGVGVEVGYAAAIGKPIVYLKRTAAPYSTTVGGSADYFAEYAELNELEEKLDEILKHIKRNAKTEKRKEK